MAAAQALGRQLTLPEAAVTALIAMLEKQKKYNLNRSTASPTLRLERSLLDKIPEAIELLRESLPG
jgi:hypothetical protein